VLNIKLSYSVKLYLYSVYINYSISYALNLTCLDALDLIVLCAEALGLLVAN